jgi:hypothetical protein
MPQPPGRVEVEATSILLGADHEHPTGAEHQVINVGPAPVDGQVVQYDPSVPFQRVEQPSGASLPSRTPWAPYLTMSEALRQVAQSFTGDVSQLSCCAA